MYCTYQEREELEDDLYQEDGESEGSDANSELEFHLYSQLHYSSNAGEMGELEDRGEKEEDEKNQQLQVTATTAQDGKKEQTEERRALTPNVNKVQKHLKKKEEKRNVQKKRKSDPKGQRVLSLLEEVIVIDSSPDVISISEDDSTDDEGVCALKGKGLHQLQTSTPAQQEERKKKRSLPVPVTVDSSSSESDSEESESSDSDVLENWMILGRGQQDGDQSISLNLEGDSDSSADPEDDDHSWLVSNKDKEAQIYNKDRGARTAVQRLSNRYYTDKNVLCRNCNKNGHLSKNCPEPKKLSPCFLCGTPGHLVSECPNKHCNNCGLPGHLYGSCSEKAYWHKQCHRCGMTGHFFDACPEIWRQYHITTKAGRPLHPQKRDNGRSPAYCYNCSKKGHFGHECTQKKMFSGVYPSTPFINRYDNMTEINRRQYRIELKVKEMTKNGYFPTTSQTHLTPGPPKKKQKINHQSNTTPHQTPNKHKPSPSHIFFTDNDFKDATPKLNKHNKYKQHESTGKAKPWKPKRSVPTSRDQLTPNKLILDESADFPRGGGKAGNLEKKKKKRNKKTKEGYRDSRLCWTVSGELQGAELKQNGEKKKKRNRARRTGDKKTAPPMYPTDENLFIIKQRKRSR